MTARKITNTYMALVGMYTLAASLIWSVNTLFLLDAGLAIGEVFLANALFSAGMVLFEIPTGVVADTLGRRISYLLSVVILAATTVLYVIAAQIEAGIITFGIVSVFMGLGFTFYSGALEAWLVDGLKAVDDHQRLDQVFARGQQVSGSAMFLGTISGGFLGQLDLAVPFVVRAVLLVVVFGIASRLMHEIGFESKPLTLSEVPSQMRLQAQVGISRGWGDQGLRMLMIASAARGIFIGWAFYAAQPYFLELLERDAVWIVGLVTAGVSLATIVGNGLVDILSRRCGKRSTLLLVASVVSSAAAITIGLTSTFAVAVTCLMLVSGAMGVTSPVRQAYLNEVVDTEYRATVISFDAMIGSVGGVGGQVGLGAISDARSFSAGYVVGGAMTVAAIPALLLLRQVGGAADDLGGDTSPGSEMTCPAGLPETTHVASHPVAVLVDKG